MTGHVRGNDHRMAIIDPDGPRGQDGVAPSAPFLAHAQTLIRGAWLVALCAAVAGTAAFAWASAQPSVYRAEMTLVVGYGPALGVPDVREGAEVLTQTLGELIDSEVVITGVLSETDADLDTEEIRERLAVSSKPSAATLEVTYDDVDRSRARVVLAEVGVQFTSLVNGIRPVSREAADARATAVVFDPAHVLADPISPHPMRALGIAAAIGALLGVTLVFVRGAAYRQGLQLPEVGAPRAAERTA